MAASICNRAFICLFAFVSSSHLDVHSFPSTSLVVSCRLLLGSSSFLTSDEEAPEICLMPFFAVLICRTLGALKLPWPDCHIHVNTLKSMHSLDLLHKCHTYVPPLKIWVLKLQCPQLHTRFFSTTYSLPRFPNLINSKAAYIFSCWWYSLWAWLIPFRLSPTPNMSATPSTLFKLRQGALPHCLTLISPRVVAVISNMPLLLFPVPVHPPTHTQQPEHFTKLSNLSPCVWNSPVLSSLLRKEGKLLLYTLQDRTLACVCPHVLPSLFTFLPLSFRGALTTFALSSMKRHSTRGLCTCSFLWCFAFLE